MPLFDFSSKQAQETAKENPSAEWGDRGAPNRVEPLALPTFDAPFKMRSGEAIFTIGSCFARNIETELMRRGFKVPVRDLFKQPEFQGIDINIINNYGTPSIYNEIAWAFGEQAFDPDDNVVEFSPGKFIDLHLSPHMRPARRDVVLRRREGALAATRAARDCRVVIMTLGLSEVWFDTKTGFYLNTEPLPTLQRRETDRFRVHVLNFEETYGYLCRAMEILRLHGHPELRVLLTVSPVPLLTTYRPVDVMVANTYSKSILRAAAETASATYPFVTYYPSYESVVLSDRLRAFDNDLRHVSRELIAINVGRMISAYCDDGYEPERIAAEIQAGGERAAYAHAAVAAKASYATAFFEDHPEWAETSADFAKIYTRHLLNIGEGADRAVEILRLHAAEHPKDLELFALLAEALVASGRTSEAKAMLQETKTIVTDKSKSFWDAIIKVAIALDEPELVLVVLQRYAARHELPVGAAYLTAGRYFQARKDLSRAILCYREAWERRGFNAAGFSLVELLVLEGQKKRARVCLKQITPINERETKTFERLMIATELSD